MSDANEENHEELPTRRDFIYVATGMMGVVGAAAIATPLVGSMLPDAAVRAAGEPVSLDVSAMEPGQVVTIEWRKNQYFVRRLTEDEIVAAQDLTPDDMKDYAPVETRTAAPVPGAGAISEGGNPGEFAIMAANCTHLGCIPTTVDAAPEGWFCPCHGSVFDMTGRILRGPAATNLPLPPYVFASDSLLVIGTDQA